jgi:hypothetical protein
MAGISGMSVKSFGDKIATLRIATVNIECYTLQQLEALELLYMRPGYRVLLEWGHTMYFDNINDNTPKQILNYIDIIDPSSKTLTKKTIYSEIKKNKENSSYNYDAIFGKVRNFSWEAQADGSYKCLAEIISLGDIIDSLKISVELLEPKKSKITDGTKDDPLVANNVFLNLLEDIKIISNTKYAKTSWGRYQDILFKDIYKNLQYPPPRSSTTQTLRTFILQTSVSKIEENLNYVRLQDLIKLMNDTCIFKEGKDPILKILDIVTSYYEAHCRSHPYQLSGDPYKFLISPYITKDKISYGGTGVDNNELNEDLDRYFPYRIPITSSSSGKSGYEPLKGDIFNILIEINYIKSVFESLITEEQNKYNVYLKDFIQTILDDFASSTGFINDLSLVLDPTDDSQYMIIDNNLMEAKFTDAENKYYTIPLMGVGNSTSPSTDGNNKGGTYVRSYRLNTQLTNNIATIVSINTQVDEAPIDGYETSVFNAFNQGIRDRLQQPFSSSLNGTYTTSSLATTLLHENLIIDLRKINVGKAYPFIPRNITSPLCNNIKRYINYTNSFTKENRVTFGSYTPVPLKFNCVMDGITGIRVGQIFLLPKDRLPHQYKVFDHSLYGKGTLGKQKIGFIVFGINHNVSKGTGWVTELDCQMVMLNVDKYGVVLPKFPFVPLPTKEGYTYVRVNANEQPSLLRIDSDGNIAGILEFKFLDQLPSISNDDLTAILIRNKSVLEGRYQRIYNRTPWKGYKPVSIPILPTNSTIPIEYIVLAWYNPALKKVLLAAPYLSRGNSLDNFKSTSIGFELYQTYSIGPNTSPSIYLDNGKELWETNGIPFKDVGTTSTFDLSINATPEPSDMSPIVSAAAAASPALIPWAILFEKWLESNE